MNADVLALSASGMAGLGVYLLISRGPNTTGMTRLTHRLGGLSNQLRRFLQNSGLTGVSPMAFVSISVAVGVLTALVVHFIFSSLAPAIISGLAGTTVPTLFWLNRHKRAREAALEAWPRMIEEIRIKVSSTGASIPHALLDVGLNGPETLQPAFQAAQREWAFTTDFERTVAVLKEELNDPTADMVCETLVIASGLGGSVDRELTELANDRRADLRDRKEATAKQSGARFARNFVIIVPAGMALAGLNVGDGRAAYQSTTGQILITVGLAIMIVCWSWATRLMQLPATKRVFHT